MEKKDFQNVYAFATENIEGYITEMDIGGRDVLTLGSSCDQAFNSLLLEAREVTIFDINKRIEEFYEFKKKLILEVPREKLVEKVIYDKQFSYVEEMFSIKFINTINLYLQNDINYQKLREILESKTVKFITGDIFNIASSNIGNNKYDRVILSNVLQYLPKSNIPVEKLVYKIYKDICAYLSDEAIIQLYYLYGSMYPKHFTKVINEFDKNGVLFERSRCDEYDSVIFVKKNQNLNKK